MQGAGPERQRHVLVADDEPHIGRIIQMKLEQGPFRVTLVHDGAAALDVLRREADVDLVLLDFLMPRMNGYQFCRELRASDEHHALPVVLMSAKGDKLRGQFVEQTGAVDAIAKPFDARGLIAVVEGALKKQREGRVPAYLWPALGVAAAVLAGGWALMAHRFPSSENPPPGTTQCTCGCKERF